MPFRNPARRAVGRRALSNRALACFLAAMMAALPAPRPAKAAPGDLLQTVPNPEPAANDNFGHAIAALGSNLIVGAPNDNTGAIDAGSVYRVNASTGAIILTIRNPTPNQDDQFGIAVAALGDDILVGANLDDADGSNCGIAYLFDGAATGTTNVPIATFHNPDTTSPANDQFGASVGAVGGNALIGAPGDVLGGFSGAGSAYLMNGSTGAAIHTFNNPTPNSGDNFGYAVCGVGGSCAIGAPYDFQDSRSGSVYMYDAATGAAGLAIRNPNLSFEFFGFSLSPIGPNLLVGAPGGHTSGSLSGKAYVIDLGDGSVVRNINPASGAALDEWGYSVAGAVGVASDYALIGGPYDNVGASTDQGSAQLFDVGSGLLSSLISDPAAADFDGFGNAVAAVGCRLGIAAEFATAGSFAGGGVVYIFDGVCATPTPSPSPSATPSPSQTASITVTPTASPTPSQTTSISPTASLTASASLTATPSNSPSITPSVSQTPSISPTMTPSNSPSLTPSVSQTPSISPTQTPSSSPTLTASVSQTASISPTQTPSSSPTLTPSASQTPSISPTQTPSATPTPVASDTPTISPTASVSPTRTPSPSRTPSLTQSPTPTPTPLAPIFVLQPKPQFANAGQGVTLIAKADGAGPIAYQWFDQDGALAGETSETLAFTPATAADGGYYHCVATSPWGERSSEEAALLVFDPRLLNGAAFVGHTIPARMATGEALYVGFTMKNTSQISWSGTQGYALAAASDPAGLFQGATRLSFLDPSEVVVPLIGVHQFIGRIEAPTTPGVYTIELRMVEELVEFFGQAASVTIEVAPRPNSATAWEDYE